MRNFGKKNPAYKHGLTKHPIYNSWSAMKQRCNNPKSSQFKDYGNRGIIIEWKSFEDFVTDMFGSYKKGLTIDRINNSGNYCKKNCHWITLPEQQKNRRNNKWVLWKNQTKLLTEWANVLGIHEQTIYSRYKLSHDPKIVFRKIKHLRVKSLVKLPETFKK